MLVEEVERVQVGARRNLDELGEAVSDLTNRQRLQEGEVKEGVDRRVVRAQTVLVIAVVDGHLDRDGCVDQTDDSRGDADEVGVSPVGGTCEAKTKG